MISIKSLHTTFTDQFPPSTRNFLLFIWLSFFHLAQGIGQTKTFIDQPYIEVFGYADSLVTPDEIYISIVLSEKDAKDKMSLEELEGKMIASLEVLKIDLDKNLTTSDVISNYKYYVFKDKEVVKSKQFILMVSDASTCSQVFISLEDLGIGNTKIIRYDHSQKEQIKNTLRGIAVANAQVKAIELTKPIQQSIGQAIHITEVKHGGGEDIVGNSPGIRIRGVSSMPQSKYLYSKVDFEKMKIEANVEVKFILK
ncbi:MAG TPA: SIMPL domain-containing protein [Saprospiraceae bacterium]|nr:SIMPL domain-containing protein [Saprospiraceae bacterium]HPN68989.1 SIMPL domain-containing protein [Saprospiraceae bacterium]